MYINVIYCQWLALMPGRPGVNTPVESRISSKSNHFFQGLNFCLDQRNTTEGPQRHQSPAVLRGIQGQEVHAGKDSGKGVEVRGQSSRELTPGGEEEHHRALAAVSIQELHQILGDMKAEDPSLKSEQRFTWLGCIP